MTWSLPALYMDESLSRSSSFEMLARFGCRMSLVKRFPDVLAILSAIRLPSSSPKYFVILFVFYLPLASNEKVQPHQGFPIFTTGLSSFSEIKAQHSANFHWKAHVQKPVS